MKYIKKLNEELNEDLEKKIIKSSAANLNLQLEITEKFLYIQQDLGSTVQQVVIDKEQVKELIEILQKFAV